MFLFEWMKDLFKILVAILVADIAGVSKLYLENSISDLNFGIVGLSLWLSVIAKKIEKHISELGEL